MDKKEGKKGLKHNNICGPELYSIYSYQISPSPKYEDDQFQYRISPHCRTCVNRPRRSYYFETHCCSW